jgi:hypothetical protein
VIEDVAGRLLLESAHNAIGTMFFSTPDTVCADPGRPSGELIVARLTFQGSPPGSFALVVSDPVARILASNFIGCDDDARLLPGQVAEVMQELANIICGAALSRIESNASFDLGAPQSFRVGSLEPGPVFTDGVFSVCRLEFAGGALVCFLALREPS